MKRALTRNWWLACLPLFVGCSICQSPEDYTYNAFGGRWERADRCQGRVGSAFTPESAQMAPVNTVSRTEVETSELPATLDAPPAEEETVYLEPTTPTQGGLMIR